MGVGVILGSRHDEIAVYGVYGEVGKPKNLAL